MCDALTDWDNIPAFASKYPNLTSIDKLRYLIRHQKTNGFDEVIRKPSKEYLISAKRYAVWLEKKKNS